MSKKFSVAVCASGGGGNFQALIDSKNDLDIDICLLIVDRDCGAIERAKKNDIPFVILNARKENLKFDLEFDKAIPSKVDLIVLAGFMPIIPEFICNKWQGKIINIHPSLLPKYGGKGMYGVNVQEAVMRANEKITGCTVHFVNRDIDAGAIILQSSIDVDYRETPWQLGGRVFKEENKLLVKAVKLMKLRSKNYLMED
jgi:phosphoribosylglycinamide formyltransferase-1